MRTTPITALAVFGIGLVSALAGATDYQWVSAQSGVWDQASSFWTPTGIPGSMSSDALIGVGGSSAYTVDVVHSLTVDTITIDSSGATLAASNVTLNLGGTATWLAGSASLSGLTVYGNLDFDGTSSTISTLGMQGALSVTNGNTVTLSGLVNGLNTGLAIDSAGGTALLDHGMLTGTLASTTGTGLSVSGNSGNGFINATVNGTLTFGSGSFATMFGGFNSLSGALNMSGGSLLQMNDDNAALTVQAAGLVHGAGTLGQASPGSAVTNAGAIRADVAGGTLSVGVSSLTNSGTVAANAGSTLSLASLVQTGGSTRADGTLVLGSAMQLNGGELSGTGSILGSVNNVGGHVSPGESIGVLSISGSYVQGAAGALDINIVGFGTGQFSALSVAGAASLGGSLNTTLLDGFIPPGAEEFQILTAGSITGEFASLSDPTDWQVIYGSNYVDLEYRGPGATPEGGTVAVGILGIGMACFKARKTRPRIGHSA